MYSEIICKKNPLAHSKVHRVAGHISIQKKPTFPEKGWNKITTDTSKNSNNIGIKCGIDNDIL